MEAKDFKAMGYKFVCAEIIFGGKVVNLTYFKEGRHRNLYINSLSDLTLRAITLMDIDEAIKIGY